MTLAYTSPAGTAAQQLTTVERQLALLIENLADAALVARGLAGATDWQAKAATAFHDRATLWAGDVSGLSCLAETARTDAAHARDRALYAEATAAFTRPGGIR